MKLIYELNEERKAQKEYLKSLYHDYDPKRHDAFVMRFNQETDKRNLQEYMKNRNI
jgi:hypothetical protein